MVKKQENNRICILLCTFNGARFLNEQLDSIAAQSHQNWVVVASDDGSSDATLDILRDYQRRWGADKLEIRFGLQKGFAHNFLSLACDPKINADYYAFCDQDDVWLPQKLIAALEHIQSNQKRETPYLYCGRTFYVDQNLKGAGISELFVFPPSFRNALVQSIAGGNTMMFNKAGKKLIEKIGNVTVASHDWWIYLLMTGVGGGVFYDKTPYILYRQHPNSTIGQNKSLFAKFIRARNLIAGKFRNWNSMNVSALNLAQGYLSDSSKEILDLFKLIRTANLKDRLRLFQVCGLYRQTRSQTAILFFMLIFNKI